MKYAFIKERLPVFSVRAMSRVLKVHHSGFHAWLKSPLSKRALDDRRVTGLIKQACYDNAVAESFFQLLKRERIRQRTYATRKHGKNGMLSPIEFERQQNWKLQGA